jgi:methylmalonyl-CoA/ethylmalonyl-CoA epimerase
VSGDLTHIDHVGIAVSDLDAAVQWYEEMFGATVAHRERIESDGVDEALLKVADGYIQLLQPFTDSSPLASTTSATGWRTATPCSSPSRRRVPA